MTTELILWIEHNGGRTWTQATVPAGIVTARDLAVHVQRGGRLESNWLSLDGRERFAPRIVGTATVVARLER